MTMIQIDHTIISDDILDHHFLCNLKACQGECCIAGDAGAPIAPSESAIMEEIYPKVAPYLTQAGRDAIDKQGVVIVGSDGELETPLINGGECAFVIRDEKGIALCGIEKAYNEGKIGWKKPISCHLYPIRLKEYSNFTAVNYHRWNICSDACSLGKELQVPIYKFLKEALVRKFGQAWYDELCAIKEAIDRGDIDHA